MGSNVHIEIRAFVIQNFTFGREDAIVDDESFLDAGIIDSTGVLELVGFLEERFGITVADEDLVPANLDSVVRVARFVAQKLDGTGSRDAG
jgi:acyl carrier protein